MSVLSIFVDESGDFGQYEFHSPFYIVTLVFHDQSVNLEGSINHLSRKFQQSGLPETPIHAGPLIRKESDYSNLTLFERKRIFNSLYNFIRLIDIKYHSIIIDKKHLTSGIDLHIQITKHLSAFLKRNIEQLLKYEHIIVYYDFGQMELTKILVSVFNTIFSNVEFRKVVPADYKLFQAADLLCTLELLSKKAERKMLSKSELLFFSTERKLNKSYLKAIFSKRQ